MNWVEKLQDILAREATGHFQEKKVEIDEFREYVNHLTSVDDWDPEFIEACYNMYLDKINKAGNELTDKMS